MADVVLPVVPEIVLVVVRAHGAVDVRAARAGLDRLEGRVLERDHVVEHPRVARLKACRSPSSARVPSGSPTQARAAPVTSTSPSWKTMLFASACGMAALRPICPR